MDYWRKRNELRQTVSLLNNADKILHSVHLIDFLFYGSYIDLTEIKKVLNIIIPKIYSKTNQFLRIQLGNMSVINFCHEEIAIHIANIAADINCCYYLLDILNRFPLNEPTFNFTFDIEYPKIMHIKNMLSTDISIASSTLVELINLQQLVESLTQGL